jgi:hypothetical protein
MKKSFFQMKVWTVEISICWDQQRMIDSQQSSKTEKYVKRRSTRCLARKHKSFLMVVWMLIIEEVLEGSQCQLNSLLVVKQKTLW